MYDITAIQTHRNDEARIAEQLELRRIAKERAAEAREAARIERPARRRRAIAFLLRLRSA